MVQPETVNDVTFDDIIEKLKNHLEPKSSVIVYRYKFDKIERGNHQTIADFINQLRHLAEDCNFGTMLNERLPFPSVFSENPRIKRLNNINM